MRREYLKGVWACEEESEERMSRKIKSEKG